MKDLAEIGIFIIMSITYANLQGRDFAEHCVNALADIKRALPKSWQQVLAPYKQQITEEAEKTHDTNTNAVLNLLSRINTANMAEATLKMQHFFLLAAYCDML